MAFSFSTLPPNFGKAETPGDQPVNLNKVLIELQNAAKLAVAGPLVVVQVGLATTGALTLTGAKVGDVVSGVANLTTPGSLKTTFESVISVAGQIQQIVGTNLSAAQCQFIITRNS